jgi:hypothetical protein
MPDLRDQFANLNWLIKAIGALIAILPGIAILLGLVDIPPDLKDLIKYVSFGISLVIIIAVILLTPSIKRLSRGWAAVIILVCVALGSASAIASWSYGSSHIVSVPYEDGVRQYVIPSQPSAQLRALTMPFGGDYVEALQVHVQRDRIVELMRRESAGTILRIVLLFLSAQALLIIAIVLGAWKVTATMKAKPAASPSPDA